MSCLTIEKLSDIVVSKLDEDGDFYNTFVETGTYFGDTTFNLCNYFERFYTIELSLKHYNLMKSKLETIKEHNIHQFFGDSSIVMKDVLNVLNDTDRTIFFLDGHWSSGDTAKGDKDCPLIEECSSIDEFYKSDCAIVLVDDYRLFGTFVNEDWSNISENQIFNCFKNFEVVNTLVHDDVLSFKIVRKNES